MFSAHIKLVKLQQVEKEGTSADPWKTYLIPTLCWSTRGINQIASNFKTSKYSAMFLKYTCQIYSQFIHAFSSLLHFYPLVIIETWFMIDPRWQRSFQGCHPHLAGKPHISGAAYLPTVAILLHQKTTKTCAPKPRWWLIAEVAGCLSKAEANMLLIDCTQHGLPRVTKNPKRTSPGINYLYLYLMDQSYCTAQQIVRNSNKVKQNIEQHPGW